MKITLIRIVLILLLACSPALLPVLKPVLPTYTNMTTVYKIFFLTPFILFGLVAFLGLRLNQTRILYSMAVFTLLFILTDHPPVVALQSLNYSLLLKTVLILSVLNFLLLFSLDEGALLGFSSFLKASGIVISMLLSYWIVYSKIFIFPTLFSGQWFTTFSQWVIPDILWPVLIITTVFLLIRPDKSIYSFKVALILSLIPLILAFNQSLTGSNDLIASKIYHAYAFNIIGLIALYSVYKLYWQNVYIDDLTGVPNRRAFNEQLKKLGRKYTIAMLDVDHFKKFNDNYGHTEGDNVLRYVAAHLKDASNSNVFRYGGEEFSIVYSGYKIKDVLWRLEQMREELATRQFYIRMEETNRRKQSEKNRENKANGRKKARVTISIGIAQRTDRFKTTEDVINAADKALYMAKNKGRNLCVIKH
jgi:diguanylate cyclase (GGDEF)-like protein